jgi:hypothetical protein
MGRGESGNNGAIDRIVILYDIRFTITRDVEREEEWLKQEELQALSNLIDALLAMAGRSLIGATLMQRLSEPVLLPLQMRVGASDLALQVTVARTLLGYMVTLRSPIQSMFPPEMTSKHF